MERKPYWYSVIQYYPSTLKGEIINVGVILHQPDSGDLKYHILDHNNIKLKGILSNPVRKEAYKVTKDVIEYYLKQSPNINELFQPNINEQTFLLELNSRFTNDFKLSEPTFSLTSNKELFFKQLLYSYIGKEFINPNETHQITTKKFVRNYFDERQLIDKKIKTNIKFSPIKEVESMHLVIDFVYKNGVINLMQAVPSSSEHFTNWYTKMNTITSEIRKECGIYLLYNKNDALNVDNTVTQILDYLKSKDKRIKTFEINSKDFISLCSQIEKEGKNVEEFESELITLQGA
jgi:Protein of unknown function (DUF3037)